MMRRARRLPIRFTERPPPLGRTEASVCRPLGVSAASRDEPPGEYLQYLCRSASPSIAPMDDRYNRPVQMAHRHREPPGGTSERRPPPFAEAASKRARRVIPGTAVGRGPTSPKLTSKVRRGPDRPARSRHGSRMLAQTFGAGQVAYSILWFFLFFIEIWLMIAIFIDIFRSHDLSGWAKALWVIFVLVVPLVGILAYLIVRGGQMRAHQHQFGYGQSPPWGTPPPPSNDRGSVVEQLARLAELRDRGDISADEYQELKEELIHGDTRRW